MRLIPNTKSYTRSKFKKNKSAIICPVCGNKHRYHCSITEDESLVVCKNTWSERQAQDGRYIHILKETDHTSGYDFAPSIEKESTPERAEADTLDAVYTAFLSELILTPAHGDTLLNERGLSDTAIAYNLYASVPGSAEGNNLAEVFSHNFDLTGVPGFYKQNEVWRLNTSIKGYYVPYRDERGRIVGLQIRRDGNPEPKYLWLTSVDEPGGASPGSPLHFVKPDIARRTRTVLITEGALKADRISDFTDESVVALAGVTAMTPDKFISVLRRALPKLQKAIMAFDMDWKIKKEVRAALIRLARALEKIGLEVPIRTWNSTDGKGLDDKLFQMGRNN